MTYHNGVAHTRKTREPITVKLIHKILNPFVSNNRFDRYYGNVLQQGEGYPTADEARKDLRNQDVNKNLVGWLR